jgi:hypothetical protein
MCKCLNLVSGSLIAQRSDFRCRPPNGLIVAEGVCCDKASGRPRSEPPIARPFPISYNAPCASEDLETNGVTRGSRLLGSTLRKASGLPRAEPLIVPQFPISCNARCGGEDCETDTSTRRSRLLKSTIGQ